MLVAPAFAKVNLALDLVGRRADGMHDIESMVVAIDWHDLIGVSIDLPAAASMSAPTISLRVSGAESAAVPQDRSNIAARAAEALSELASRRVDVHVWLDKTVPSRAGLGGGSTDAAMVLRTGSRLLDAAGVPVSADALATVAAGLGADVPVLLSPGLTLVSGTGDRLIRCPDVDIHLAVAIAGSGDTAAAYGRVRDSDLGTDGRVARIQRAVVEGTWPGDADLGSALERPACEANPKLAVGLRRLREATPGHRWHLTGSGGCAFSRTPSAAAADQLVTAVRRSGLGARRCRSVPSGLR